MPGLRQFHYEPEHYRPGFKEFFIRSVLPIRRLPVLIVNCTKDYSENTVQLDLFIYLNLQTTGIREKSRQKVKAMPFNYRITMKNIILASISAVAALMAAVSCDSSSSHSDLSEVSFGIPAEAIAGEQIELTLSERIEDLAVYIGGREFTVEYLQENEEGGFSFWLCLPEDFKGEYDVTAKDLDSKDGAEFNIGHIAVWQLSGEPEFSTGRPVRTDLSGSVMILNSCKVTMDGIEKLDFYDMDGKPVKAELYDEQAVSSLYSTGTVTYCSEFDVICPHDGSYEAYREYTSEVSVPVIIRNRDGIMLPVGRVEKIRNICSVSGNVFYFSDNDPAGPVYMATVDGALFPVQGTDFPDDMMDRTLRPEALSGSEGKLDYHAGVPLSAATSDGKVFLNEQYVYNGDNTIEMSAPSDDYGSAESVFALDGNLIMLKGYVGESTLYYASVGERSGSWRKFDELDCRILYSSAVVYNDKAYLMGADRYFVIDTELNVTEHDYYAAPGNSEGQYVPGNPHNESWWYYYDKDSFNFCRMKLEEMSFSGPEILSEVPQFMFHSLDDVAVWNTYDGGKVVINIISEGESAMVRDNEGLLSETNIAYDSGAVTNTFLQEE